MTVADRKRALRRELRAVRRALPERAERSAVITNHLLSVEAIDRAAHVLAYAAVPGEVDLTGFLDRLASAGRQTAIPEDDVTPDWPDVVVVPGVAFTERCERLGQGGGWYDRFLTQVRDGVPLIGVAFEAQIVDSLPIEPHDVVLDGLVTEVGTRWRSDAGR